MYKLDLENKKYTIIEDLGKGRFEALRYGNKWRNLIGDNLILALVYKIQELEKELEEKNKSEMNKVLDLTNSEISWLGLAPRKRLLNDYKYKGIPWEDYTKIYYNELRNSEQGKKDF